MVIYLARVFSADSEERGTDLCAFAGALCDIGVFFMLILMQPDFCTAVILLLVAVTVSLLRVFPHFILPPFLRSVFPPCICLCIRLNTAECERILGYLDPWKDRFGLGYHIIQSFVSFKKGGICSASALVNGTQKLGRLPEPHNDFIFSV
jgi:cell division protein FtsW